MIEDSSGSNPGPAPGERRLARRVQLRQGGNVTLDGMTIPIADLSLSGIRIAASRPPRVGQRYAMQIHLGPTKVSVAGRVARCRISAIEPASNGEGRIHYDVGLEFVNLTPRGLTSISRVIDAHV